MWAPWLVTGTHPNNDQPSGLCRWDGIEVDSTHVNKSIHPMVNKLKSTSLRPTSKLWASPLTLAKGFVVCICLSGEKEWLVGGSSCVLPPWPIPDQWEEYGRGCVLVLPWTWSQTSNMGMPRCSDTNLYVSNRSSTSPIIVPCTNTPVRPSKLATEGVSAALYKSPKDEA